MIIGAEECQDESGNTFLKPHVSDLENLRAFSPAIAEIIDAVDYNDAQSVIHVGRCLEQLHDRLASCQSGESAPDRSTQIRALRRVYVALASHQSELIAE